MSDRAKRVSPVIKLQMVEIPQKLPRASVQVIRMRLERALRRSFRVVLGTRKNIDDEGTELMRLAAKRILLHAERLGWVTLGSPYRLEVSAD